MRDATGMWEHGFHGFGGGGGSWCRSLLMLLSEGLILARMKGSGGQQPRRLQSQQSHTQAAVWGSTHTLACFMYANTSTHTHACMHAVLVPVPSVCAVAIGLTAHTTVQHALCTRSRQTHSQTVAGTNTFSRHRRHLLVTGT